MRGLYAICLSFLLGATLSLMAGAQSLPPEMRLSADGRMLITGGAPSSGLYDQTVIRTLSLDFELENYWDQLLENYEQDVDIPATMTLDGEVFEAVGVRFKGFTSFFSTIESPKKSFNLSLGFNDADRDVMGYEALNLHNGADDPSFIREVLYHELIRPHVPALKGAFVKLMINGESWGLYPSVQQPDSEFIREWFLSSDGTRWRAIKPEGGGPGGGGFGAGTSALNYLGPDTTTYQEHYTLKKTHKTNPWDDLVATTDVLENTPLDELEAALNPYLDIDRTLWFLAAEILFADDDSYVFKGVMDYYLYWEAETGRMAPLEYDGNSMMRSRNIGWGPFFRIQDDNYPLVNRLLNVPALRQRYLAHFRTLLRDAYAAEVVEPLIDQYAALIDAEVAADDKKLFTYQEFLDEVRALKALFANRRGFLSRNAELSQIAPDISGVVMAANGEEWAKPEADAPVVVRAEVTGNVEAVRLYYSPALVGTFTALPMFDDGAHNDGAAGDGVYGAFLPGQAAGSWVRFYIEAVANDGFGTVRYLPEGAEHNVFIYQVASAPRADNEVVVINEFMASNETALMDETGDYDDWIELYNPSDNTVTLDGYYLTDKTDNLTKWAFPAGTTIPAHSYLIVWADEDGGDGPLHANFKLSASGETLVLLNPNQEVVDEVTFGTQVTDQSFARVPNGTGDFVIQPPTLAYSNDDAPTATYDAEIPQAAGLQVYPNPATQRVQVVIHGTGPTPTEVALYNLLGQRVWRGDLHGTAKVDLSGLPAGLYFVRAGAFTEKLVVVH